VAKIRVKYRGAIYEFETPKEAAETMALLESKEQERRIDHEMNRVMSSLGFTDPLEKLRATINPNVEEPIWKPRIFDLFIERLGPAQRAALTLLVLRQCVTDQEFCTELGIPGNQALAGTLSGITKQAAILNIPAREVFRIENHRKARKRYNTYFVADSFLKAAKAMNWVTPPTEK
jgi:hypothetical protein